jgi:hypothetical protein
VQSIQAARAARQVSEPIIGRTGTLRPGDENRELYFVRAEAPVRNAWEGFSPSGAFSHQASRWIIGLPDEVATLGFPLA